MWYCMCTVCVCVCVRACMCVHVCTCVCVASVCIDVHYLLAVHLLCAGNLVNKMVAEMRMKVNGSCKEEKIHFFSAVSAGRHVSTYPPPPPLIYISAPPSLGSPLSLQHDTTVACLLLALDVFDMRYPKYTSSVILEFYKKPNKYGCGSGL